MINDEWESSLNLPPQPVNPEELGKQSRISRERLAKTPNLLAAGMARLPLSIVELGDLAVQGVQAYRDNTDAPFLERFARSRYVEGGFERVQAAEKSFLEGYVRDNPNADEKSLRKALSDYRKTQDFAKIEDENLPAPRRYIQNIGETIDNAFGAPTDRQKDTFERIVSSVGASIAPTGALARAAGKSLSLPAQILLPGAAGGSVGNYVGNAAVGAAIPYVAEKAIEAYANSQTPPAIPSVVEERIEKENNVRTEATALLAQSPPDEKDKSELSTLGSVAALGVLGLFGMRSTNSINKTIRGVEPKSTAPIARNFDETAPIKDALVAAGKTKQQAREDIANVTGTYNASDEAAKYMTTKNTDYLPSSEKPKKSFFELNEMQKRIVDTGQFEDVEKALVYSSALDSRTFRLAKLEDELKTKQKQLADASVELSRINVANSTLDRKDQFSSQVEARKLSQLSKEIPALEKAIADAKADLPDSRMQFPELSINDMKEFVTNIRQDKFISEYMDGINDAFRADLAIQVNAGLRSQERASAYRKANPNYVPIRGATEEFQPGLEGLKAKLKNNYSEGGKYSEDITSITRDAKRNTDYIPFSDRIDTKVKLMPIMDELNTRMRNTFQQVALNNYRREMIKLGEETGKVIPVKASGNGTNILPPNSPYLDALLSKDNTVFYLKDGNYHLFRAETAEIARAVTRMPDAWGTFTRINAELNSWLRKGLTGSLNPIFATANMAYDIGAALTYRPLDRSFGIGNYLTKYGAPTLGTAVDKTMRATGLQAIDPTIYASAVINGIRLGMGANLTRLATKIESDMKTGLGLVNAIGVKSPKVQAMLHNMSKGLADVFVDSHVQNYIQKTGQSTPFMMETYNYVREAEGIITSARKQLGVKESIVGNATRSFISFYQDMLWGMHNGARFSYYTALVADETAKAGKPLTDAQLTKLANEARTVTGDLRKRSGSETIRTVNQNTLYLNVALQATRTMYERATENPRMTAMIISSVAVPVLGSLALMNSNRKLADWFNKEVPDWQKDSFLFVPNAQGLKKIIDGFMSTGRMTDQLTREDVATILQPPDLRWFRGAVRTVTEYTGANSQYKPTTIEPTTAWDITRTTGFGLLQNVVPSLPVWADVATKQGLGVEVNTLRLGEGTAVRQINVNERMNANSSYSRGFNEFLGSVLGTFGRNVADSLDTGEQLNRVGNSFLDSYFYAGQDFAQRASKPRTDVPFAAIMADRTYSKTPVREQFDLNRQALELSTARRAPGTQKIREAGSPLRDPVLEQVRGLLELYYNRDPTFKQLMSERSDINKLLNQTYANKGITYDERVAEINRLNRQMVDITDRINRSVNDYQTAIIGSPLGQQYKQLYNTDFSIRDWSKKAEAAYKAREFSPRQPRRQ